MNNDDIGFSATLLHEGIHAEVYKYVDERKKGIDPNNRKEVFSYYNLFKAQNSDDPPTAIAQHQHMQDAFVIPMAQAIRKLDSYRYPLEHYCGFCWEGIKEDYEYDHYIDPNNGNVQTMTPDKYKDLIKRKEAIASSSNFTKDCN